MDQVNACWQGFELDRNWMLLDENNAFLTQRQIPEMALFRLSLAGEELTVSHNKDVICFGINQLSGKKILSKVWDDPASTNEVDPLVSKWFSDKFHQKVKLVRMTDKKSRTHFVQKLNGRLPVSLADGYPYLLVGEASLNHLNQQLTEPVDIVRFRPNIVVETNEPHEEDDWTIFQAGSARFANIKPCARCKVVTINPADATQNNETLSVLSRYRKSDHQVFFGTNLICTKEGTLHKGELIIFA
jgi:uncharacterized protein YcbX